MLFNSLHFLLFLPIVVALYYLLPSRYRWILIFLASCYFYMAFVPYYILILFFIILVDYSTGILMEKSLGRRKLTYLLLSLLSNGILLCFFKYFHFLNENALTISTWMGFSFHPVNLDIVLPIGLSFHTFQSMSYSIEVYRGKQKAERHLGYFANYVLFFPQMVAGPIERYDALGNELKQERAAQYSNFSNGFRLILYGLFVKMAIADNIAPYVNEVYSDPASHTSLQVLIAVFLFSFQIYADFYGYSTIALGSARLLGIQIMDNFKTPYLSRSISEFWTRWHISLSTWFRDYLYLPLGGNRVAILRWCFNIMIVFMVSGLWHGASWTFVVWGALHGAVRVMEHLFVKLTGIKIKDNWSVWNILLTVKTFILTSFIWIFFRAENFEKAKKIINTMVTCTSGEFDFRQLIVPMAAVVIMVLTDCMLYNSRFDQKLSIRNVPVRWAIYTILLFGLLALSGTQKFTFIYFQF